MGVTVDETTGRVTELQLKGCGLKGHLPDVITEVEISFYLLRRLLGVKTQEGGKQAKVRPSRRPPRPSRIRTRAR